MESADAPQAFSFLDALRWNLSARVAPARVRHAAAAAIICLLNRAFMFFLLERVTFLGPKASVVPFEGQIDDSLSFS
jgi:hypothetical protein